MLLIFINYFYINKLPLENPKANLIVIIYYKLKYSKIYINQIFISFLNYVKPINK